MRLAATTDEVRHTTGTVPPTEPLSFSCFKLNILTTSVLARIGKAEVPSSCWRITKISLDYVSPASSGDRSSSGRIPPAIPVVDWPMYSVGVYHNCENYRTHSG